MEQPQQVSKADDERATAQAVAVRENAIDSATTTPKRSLKLKNKENTPALTESRRKNECFFARSGE
jgi:hypothetical protein